MAEYDAARFGSSQAELYIRNSMNVSAELFERTRLVDYLLVGVVTCDFREVRRQRCAGNAITDFRVSNFSNMEQSAMFTA